MTESTSRPMSLSPFVICLSSSARSCSGVLSVIELDLNGKEKIVKRTLIWLNEDEIYF